MPIQSAETGMMRPRAAPNECNSHQIWTMESMPKIAPRACCKLAVRLVRSDRVFRQARANLTYNEESVSLAEAAIDAHNADIERFEAQDRVANGLSIAIARGCVGHAEETLGRWRHAVAIAEQQLAAVKEGRDELIGLFVGHFLDRADTPDAVIACLSEEVLEAIGRCIETQERLEDERALCDVIHERKDLVHARLMQVRDQHDLDLQLEQIDHADTELVGRKMAKDRGTIQAMETQLVLLDRSIDSLLEERDDADESLCASLDEMVVTANLLEADRKEQDTGAAAVEARTSSAAPQSQRDEALNDRSDGAAPQPTEQTLEQRLRAAKAQARIDLAQAERRFQEVRETYDANLQLWRITRWEVDGDSQSDFDRDHFRSCQLWTGKIIAAEKEVERVKLALVNAGIPPSDTAESGFVDLPEDGYRESLERAVVGHVDRPAIEAWLIGVYDQMKMVLALEGSNDEKALPTGQLPETVQDADLESSAEWPDDVQDADLQSAQRDALVDFGEGVSVVAVGRDADRLHNWKEIQKREAGELPAQKRRYSASELKRSKLMGL